jgi:hypothetical protein
MPEPLTKSRFKLAINCPTKLHYAKPANAYRNKNDGNEFLAALADGGATSVKKSAANAPPGPQGLKPHRHG